MFAIPSALLGICLIAALCTTPTLCSPILDDLFRGFVRDAQLATNEPPRERNVVKRRIYADNPDASLKQISLQSLIGNVEDGLFQTALSVGGIGVVGRNNDETIVPEVKPPHAAAKRQTSEFSTTESSADKETKNILLQTTQKIAAANGVPAHILIDRVAVHQHQGGVPIIPAFEVYRTKVISATFKEPSVVGQQLTRNEGASTKVSISQTDVGGILPATANPSGHANAALTKDSSTQKPEIIVEGGSTVPNDKASSSSSSSSHSPLSVDSSSKDVITEKTEKSEATTTTPTTTTLAPTITTTTTKLPIDQLKEAEDELKEKVAEIEAEPVILSARV